MPDRAEAPAPTPAPAVSPTAPGPIREVLALPSYRQFWASQFLFALVNGSLRFVFIWLVITEVTQWSPAAGLVGLAIGLPALLLSLPAGAWSDRADRRLLVIRGAVAAAVLLAVTAVAVAVEVMTLGLAMSLGFLVAACLAVLTPAVQAMVPSLVPRERLVSGVALQNLGMQMAMFVGNIVGGIAIALTGTVGAFVVLSALKVLSAAAMSRVQLPPVVPPGERRSVRHDVAEGLRYVWGTEPLRSLTGVSLLIGITVGVLFVNLPEVSESILGQGAFTTSLLLGAVGLGMMGTSLYLASRRDATRLGRNVAVAISLGLGPGLVLLGVSRAYVLSLAVMLLWGLSGGAAMTSHRTLVQGLTPDGFMGRVMGIQTLVLAGSFPLGAVLTAATAGWLGPDGVMVVTGAAVTVLALPLTMRRVIRSA